MKSSAYALLQSLELTLSSTSTPSMDAKASIVSETMRATTSIPTPMWQRLTTDQLLQIVQVPNGCDLLESGHDVSYVNAHAATAALEHGLPSSTRNTAYTPVTRHSLVRYPPPAQYWAMGAAAIARARAHAVGRPTCQAARRDRLAFTSSALHALTALEKGARRARRHLRNSENGSISEALVAAASRILDKVEQELAKSTGIRRCFSELLRQSGVAPPCTPSFRALERCYDNSTRFSEETRGDTEEQTRLVADFFTDELRAANYHAAADAFDLAPGYKLDGAGGLIAFTDEPEYVEDRFALIDNGLRLNKRWLHDNAEEEILVDRFDIQIESSPSD